MIMKRNIIFLLGVVCLMASCSREEYGDFRPEPTPGEEVRFSANVVGDSQTKTLYGADQPDSIMVKWVNGDLISVYGKTGGNQVAEYKVVATTNPTNTPNVDNGQVYADDLQKTAVSGVQWGDEETANFMAIYPSAGASFPAENQIKTTISATQNYVFSAGYKTGVLDGVDYDGNTVKIDLWEGTHFGSNATNPSMQNAIMFARTEGVANGSTVDLHFKPFSTVLKFRFMGFNSSLTNPTIYVQSIKVTAPSGTNISGDFTLTVSGSAKNAIAQAAAAGNNTNSITLNTILPGGGYIPLKAHQAIDFNVFTIPLDDVKMGGDVTKKVENGKTTYSCEHPWTVEVKTAQHGTFTYNIIPKVENLNTLPAGTHEAQEFTLAKGEIHKVKIPQLTVMGTVDWDPTKWMTQIPTPVYLSELSIPGAWYCMDSGYQNTTDIATLYNAGIRAFNIDCRITKKTSANDHSLLGRWGADAEWNDSNYTSNAYLACAGTEKNEGISIPLIGSAQNLKDGQYVADVITSICDIAQKNPKEYVVIVFTFAEKPKTISNQYVYGSVRADYITEQLNTILSTDAIKNYLYTNVTKNTTIEDVINSGKNVIVKINHSNVDFATSTTPSFSMPTGHMASFASMATDGYIQTGVTDIISGLTTNTSPYYGYYAKMQTSPIYNGKATTDLTYYSHQAQKTSSNQTRGNTTFSAVPTLGQRMDAIDDIIKKSVEIYDASSHNAWFQLGIGGSLDGDDPAGVSSVLNEYVRGVIEEKIATDPSPVGLVLMNHATDASGNPIQLVKDIIEMNGKFYLKRAGGDVITGDGDGTNQGTTPQPAPASNAAYAVVGGNAF